MSIVTNVKAQFDPTVQRITGRTVFGDLVIDVPYISEISPNLWQGGCPSPLDGHPVPKIILPRAIKHVVSLYQGGAYRLTHDLESCMTVRMSDSTDQGMDQVEALATWVNVCRATGPVLVHCQAGLNRSSLVSARALMFEGMSARDAIDLIRTKRSPAALCNQAFEDYLLSL